MWFRLAYGPDEPRAASQITMLSEELTAIDTRRALRMMAQAEKSVELFMAARQNESTESTQAMALLGAQLLSGVSVEQDEAIAVQWLQRAVTRNHPYAQLTLGMAYATGRGVRKIYPRLCTCSSSLQSKVYQRLTINGRSYLNSTLS